MLYMTNGGGGGGYNQPETSKGIVFAPNITIVGGSDNHVVPSKSETLSGAIMNNEMVHGGNPSTTGGTYPAIRENPPTTDAAYPAIRENQAIDFSKLVIKKHE